MYCKKWPSVAEHDMVGMFASAREVTPGAETGELAELVDKVRLVEVPAHQGQLRPIYPLPAVDDAQELLKTPDAGEQLGRLPDFVAEDLDEPLAAEAAPLYDLRDRPCVRHAPEVMERQ